MKKSFVLVSSFIAILIFFNDCRSDKYIPGICFNSDILPIFVTRCGGSGCHNSASKEAGYDLTSYNGIMKGIIPGHPLQSEIFSQIKGNRPAMPPIGDAQLSAKEIALIKSWIEFGAHETSAGCKTGCDTTSFLFSKNVKPIIDAWCVSCHNTTNPGGGYDFSGYNGVASAITAGRLLGSINQQPGYSAMPQGSGKLSDCDIKIITKWVNNNYPDN